MKQDRLALLFAAGGTGGHLFPALAVAEYVRKERPDAAIVFIGAHGKMEERIVPQHGFPLRLLWIEGINRTRPMRLAKVPFQVLTSIMRVIAIMRSLKPGAAVCAGSYVSYPVGVAARLMNIPLILMESNARPGKVIRALAPRAAAVHVAFEKSKEFFVRRDNIMVSGNPVREELSVPMVREEAVRMFGLDPAKQVLLVFGGSLGARSINAAVAQALAALRSDGTQVIWQTGRDAGVTTPTQPGVWRSEFIEDMRAAYSAADLVVCRAGGTTLAELTVVGVPSILVPYPHHADQHQVRNAESMRDAGAAEILMEARMAEMFLTVVRALLADRARQTAMRLAAHALGKRDATARIAENILALAAQHG